jgi:hypothetical protein
LIVADCITLAHKIVVLACLVVMLEIIIIIYENGFLVRESIYGMESTMNNSKT